jgi:hypothetical protein
MWGRKREHVVEEPPIIHVVRAAAREAARETYTDGFKAGVTATLDALEARFPEKMPRSPAAARYMHSPERATVMLFIAETRRRIDADEGES